jgi:hypothetical protein
LADLALADLDLAERADALGAAFWAFRNVFFLRFALLRKDLRFAMDQKTSAGAAALKNTASLADASPRNRLLDNSQTEYANQDQIGRNDEVEQPRNDENENAGNERDNRLQVSDANNHDRVPLGCVRR